MSVFASLLNNTFTVYRRVRTSDGQGGWTISYALVGTLEGRIAPKATAERVVGDSEEAQITHTLYCVAAENVARGDLVASGGLLVEVLGVREPSLADQHWEIDCLERQDEVQLESGS